MCDVYDVNCNVCKRCILHSAGLYVSLQTLNLLCVLVVYADSALRCNAHFVQENKLDKEFIDIIFIDKVVVKNVS